MDRHTVEHSRSRASLAATVRRIRAGGAAAVGSAPGQPVQPQPVARIRQLPRRQEHHRDRPQPGPAGQQEHQQNLVFHRLHRRQPGQNLPGHDTGQRHQPGRRHLVDHRQQPAPDGRAHQPAHGLADRRPQAQLRLDRRALAHHAGQQVVQRQAGRAHHGAQHDAGQRNGVAGVVPWLRTQRGGQRQHAGHAGGERHRRRAGAQIAPPHQSLLRPRRHLAAGHRHHQQHHRQRYRRRGKREHPRQHETDEHQLHHHAHGRDRQLPVHPQPQRYADGAVHHDQGGGDRQIAG